ncbi:COP-coated vesicle membrane protein gp25L precursor [Perkinsela sp. CCAP 1560/4]|nr:COP-coated vesicle membrane protein gp25L precursor [Perkinsela sp. CCAP 1560/4]KNH08931.1 COP-coated vesicle membrane protein gp25L precursor [Perkinsela sp. CCAP 1560/4]|eukprot:KNH04297.1 COP-coated vesicle membrane protein gp25L precursor [Perkinsela sp. CCAP 1560/4]
MIALLSGLCLAESVQCFNFDLDARSHRCFTEELPEDQKVSGSYRASDAYGVFTDFRVSDPNGGLIQSDTGSDQNSFYFATNVPGEHRFCFYNRVAQGVRYQKSMKRQINFQLRLGKEAKDYSNVATKYHLKPIQVELRVMEDITKAVQSEYLYFHEREESLRVLSDALSGRATWLSLVTLCISIGFGYWQYAHLRNFFKSKRLID